MAIASDKSSYSSHSVELDNELDEDAKGRLLARLAKDEALRKRYEALREAKAQITASFDALLEMAPLARLRAALPPEGAPRAASGRFAGVAFRELAAGIVVGLLAATAAWVSLALRRGASRKTGVRRSSNTRSYTPARPLLFRAPMRRSKPSN